MSYDKINQDHVDGCPQYLRVLDDHDRHQKIHGETKKSDKSQCDRCSDVHHRTDLILGIVNDILHGATIQGHSSYISLPLHFYTFPLFFFFFFFTTDTKKGKKQTKKHHVSIERVNRRTDYVPVFEVAQEADYMHQPKAVYD